MKKKFKALVLSCIDPRFQSIVYNFLKKKNSLANTAPLLLLDLLLVLQKKDLKIGIKHFGTI